MTTEAPDTELTELTARLRGEAGPWPTEEEPEQADTELGFLFRESGELVTCNVKIHYTSVHYLISGVFFTNTLSNMSYLEHGLGVVICGVRC